MSGDDKTRILPNLADTTVGTQLSGIYELDERIAFGGMGEVYRGHNIQTGDHVAIKIVLPEFARDQTILSLFRKEASILNHLSHDAVVRYHVFTIDPGIGRPYLAMEFVDGESLFDVMRRGAMATEDVRKLCHRLASGLSAVHEAGAIHRDLSPDNIILPGGKVQRAKIIDFGIARSATIGGETLIGGKFAGKYNYVSPEQLGLYGGDVSEQSDIYSLGLVLAAALRGKPIDMGGSQFEIVEKRRTVPDLSDIDADFRPIIEAMLQSAPQDRPASMAEIAAMTRDDKEGTKPPTSLTPRDRLGLPQSGEPMAPGPKVQGQPPNVEGHGVPPAAAPGEPRFVPHIRPAHLSEPKAPAIAAAPGVAAKKPATTRNLTIAALTVVLVASVAGIYASGFLNFGGQFPVTGTGSAENPAPGSQPAEDSASAPAASRSATVHPPTKDATASPANPPEAKSEPGQKTDQQAGGGSGQAEVALNAAKPQLPATDAIGSIADHVSWLRDYSGGDCFYATATSATDKAMEIEGFGTSAAPFDQMRSAFRAKFHIEPVLSLRLIEPTQCNVTNLLRSLDGAAAAKPKLALDQTAVSSGSPVSGTLETQSGLISNVFLIDHKGMAFNLGDRVDVQSGKANFSIPIGLGAADKAAGKPLPQIMMVVTGPEDIQAAAFSTPVPASVLLPKILDEIRAKDFEFSATAKYFLLGG